MIILIEIEIIYGKWFESFIENEMNWFGIGVMRAAIYDRIEHT